jgi:hypothetical protein
MICAQPSREILSAVTARNRQGSDRKLGDIVRSPAMAAVQQPSDALARRPRQRADLRTQAGSTLMSRPPVLLTPANDTLVLVDLLRLCYVAAPGQGTFTPAEIGAALAALTERIDTGRWPAASPAAMNTRGAVLDHSASGFADFDPGPGYRPFFGYSEYLPGTEGCAPWRT